MVDFEVEARREVVEPKDRTVMHNIKVEHDGDGVSYGCNFSLRYIH